MNQIHHVKSFDPEPKNIGLGDAVAMMAKPIAKAIDLVTGTNLKSCGGCAKRQAALNRIIPNLTGK